MPRLASCHGDRRLDLNVQFLALTPMVACGAHTVVFMTNILGVGIAATFELIVTLLAIFELLVFMGGWRWASHGATLPPTAGRRREFTAAWRRRECLPRFPFAIWFFLAIEGASMAAEEAKDPQRTIPRALGGGS